MLRPNHSITGYGQTKYVPLVLYTTRAKLLRFVSPKHDILFLIKPHAGMSQYIAILSHSWPVASYEVLKCHVLTLTNESKTSSVNTLLNVQLDFHFIAT